MMKINNELRDKCHEIACNLGWHKEEHSKGECGMFVITEMSDAVKAYLNDRHANKKGFYKFNPDYGFEFRYNAYIQNTVEENLADAIIRCLDLAAVCELDVENLDGDIVPFDEVTPYINPTFPELVNEVITFFCVENWGSQRIYGLIISILSYSKENDIDILWYLEQKIDYSHIHAEKINASKIKEIWK